VVQNPAKSHHTIWISKMARRYDSWTSDEDQKLLALLMDSKIKTFAPCQSRKQMSILGDIGKKLEPFSSKV
jgi:hypothetical protein